MSKILFQKKLSFKPQPPIRNAVSLHILKIVKKWCGLKVNNCGNKGPILTFPRNP